MTESGKAPPSTDEPGRGETQKSILAMSEEELVALEERAKKIGGTGESPFVHRSPFASSSLSLSPHVFSSSQASSFVSHVPHITGSRYFGVDQEHAEDVKDSKSFETVHEHAEDNEDRKITNVFICVENLMKFQSVMMTGV